jgi:hypothetical protein
MVEFLLHNTLGAWWAGKIGPIRTDTEEEARVQAALPARDGVPEISWIYLRFVQNEATKTWLPAAGTFGGWPKLARLIRLLDPCMGSGHFLVFALPLLVRLRMEEEKLSAQASVVAVLKDNIHGLELDERCTQIAAFNVALTAWKLAGYQILPPLNLACSGLAPNATEAEWVALAGESDRLQRGMTRLYNLFKDAPVLGSLINPRAFAGDMIEAEFHELAPLLTIALTQSENKKAKYENDAVELAVIAQGIAKAAELLAGIFTLVITNVPYLGRNKQTECLMNFCETYHPKAEADLATCFGERCLSFSANGGTRAEVTQQSWLFQPRYQALRETVLRENRFEAVVRLGEHAFESPDAAGAFVVLQIVSNCTPLTTSNFLGLDAARHPTPVQKAHSLFTSCVILVSQEQQLKNPECRIAIDEIDSQLPQLSFSAECYQGLRTGDREQYVCYFWEIVEHQGSWEFLRTCADGDIAGGQSHVLLWEGGRGRLFKFASQNREKLHDMHESGNRAWGKIGIAFGQLRSLPRSLYFGDKFDNSVAVIFPKREQELLAVAAFCASDSFVPEVRKLNQGLYVSNATFTKVPFDLAHWQKVAAEKYPNGLPKPQSDDPTQWLFNGHPNGSEQPLHVAVIRLLGYQWPRQTGSSFPDCPALGLDGLESFADDDGIVCLPPLNHEQPAAARLRQLLVASLGTFDERALIAAAGLKGSKSKTLEDWLRDEFFEQHAKLFHDRPFIWHLWDGRSDGFHALVNYHKFDHATLQKLTYSYLGNWIQQQSDDAKADKPGAAERLGAARILQTKLAAILQGEAPLDIFVRWKSIKEQAQGWHPEINDGIRQNIRPFLLAGDVGKRGAGLFRAVPLAFKDKDRGTEPIRPKSDYPWFWCEHEPGTDPEGGEEFMGNRWNNVHLTLAKKTEGRT